MPDTLPPPRAALASRIDRWAADRPDIALMAPFLAYLLLLATRDFLPEHYNWLASVIRGVGTMAVVWLLRKHLPLSGRPHLPLAILAGAALALLWVAGQHFFDQVGLPHRLPLPLFPGEPESPSEIDPFNKYASGGPLLIWSTIILRIAVACTAVPIVEEIFWRFLMLRLLINWAEFDKVPVGQFTWFSFLFSSLLSTLQHPDNWAVSIPCWMAFNLLFYWKTSVPFLILVHAFTNLFLYVYVVAYGDWIFW